MRPFRLPEKHYFQAKKVTVTITNFNLHNLALECSIPKKEKYRQVLQP